MALSNGAIAGIVIGGVVLLLVANQFYKTYKITALTPDEAQKYYAESSASSEAFFKGITTPFIIVIYFLPYFVAFYAIFNDIVTSTFSMSIGVVLGVILNLINLVLSKIFGTAMNPSDLCGLPGLSGLNSSFIPQAPLFASAVTGYIAMFSTLLHGASTPTYVSWGLSVALSLAQYYTLIQNRMFCLDSMTFGFLSGLISIVVGTGSGALTAFLVQKYYLPSGSGGVLATTSPGAPLGSSTTPPDSNVGTCSAPNDQDQFVCETYKDGKLVTSTIASS